MRNKLLIIGVLLLLTLGTAYALTYKVLTTVITVGTSATALPTTAMVGREYIQIQNVGTVALYIGDANVTADTAATGGITIFPYGMWVQPYDNSVVVYGIVASSTCKTVVEEGK